jgi:signal transduction histidine kinase
MVYQSLADQLSIAIENAQAYEAERKTVERLRELDRIQSRFLTNMSHALRTPLNTVIGFSRVLLREFDGPLNETQRADTRAIYDSGRQLLGLINDMLELSQLELGVAPFALENVDLYEIIEGVMATTRALARGKPIQVYEEVAEDLPSLHTDGQRVRQVILALLSNAVKLTESGSISLQVTTDDGHVLIAVTDTGRGISQEERERIFSDGGPGEPDGDGRSGFGLAISKRVVEKLGGQIWLESEEGVGATFRFSLPLRSPEQGVGGGGREHVEES